LGSQRLRVINFEGFVATPAQGIRRAELHQITRIATQYLAGLNAS
jgi:hypothetical protein